MKTRVQRLSRFLGVSRQTFKQNFILDPVLGVDVNVFVDPQRLMLTKIPEFAQSRGKLEDYLADIFRAVIKSKQYEDPWWIAARDRVAVKEIQGVGIGFSSGKDTGNAIGKKLADQLLKTAQFIHQHGIEDPVAFELLGLFEDNFGPDRLSDFVINALRVDFLSYTEKVTALLKLPAGHTFAYLYRGHQYLVPFRVNKKNKRFPVTLLPLDILRDLPVALDPSEIEDAGNLKKELKEAWHSIVQKAWKETREKPGKEERKELFMQHPEFFHPLIKVYREGKRPPYDFDSDPKGLIKWFDIAEDYLSTYPLKLQRRISTLEQLLDTVDKIVGQFKKNIELNGLNKHLYDSTGDPRNEEYAQKLFFTAADGYCAANDLDISPESDAGKGPVDFKLSRGNTKVVVEMKLSRHSRIVHGYTKQLSAYRESEGAIASKFVVIKVTQNESRQLKEVRRLYKEAKEKDSNCPELVVIDGLIYPSASKL
jgi:hypothetical protein